MNLDLTVLTSTGFAADPELLTKRKTAAESNDMHATGPYSLLGAFRRGAVSLVFEQNICEEPVGNGLAAVIAHPAVCVVSGPMGAVTCSASDTALILRMADELA